MKNYFNFSRVDKIGVALMSVVIVTLIVVLNVGSSFYLPDPFPVEPEVVEEFRERNQTDIDSTFIEVENRDFYTKKEIEVSEIEPFDPNQLDEKGWVDLGFSQKQAVSILKYKNKLGGFSSKEQLKDAYVISSKKYEEIEPYIDFKEQNLLYNEPVSDIIAAEILNLNRATADELLSLKGVGDFTAHEVIKFRERRGGFIEFSQLEELPIPENAKKVLQSNSFINPEEVTKTNLNSASKKELRNIPFSNWLVTTRILKMRDQQKITDLNFLTKEEIKDEDLLRLMYYISF